MTIVGPLFPSGVVVREADPARIDGPLFPGEAAVIERAVEKRRREFVAGRVLARAALAALGVPEGAVPVGEGRSPVWPADIVGSIAHTLGFCAVVVARRSDALVGLGFDVEPDAPLREAVLDRIARPEERQRLREQGDPARLGRLLFCAKEALYKAQYPSTGRFLGFHDVRVDLDVGAGVFSAQVVGEAADDVDLSHLEGRVRVVDGFMLAGAVLRGGVTPSASPRS